MSGKIIAIAWSSHSQRLKSIAASLNGQSFLIFEERGKPWLLPWRYLKNAWKTWQLLEKYQPEAVIVQAPPIFAPLVVMLWSKYSGLRRPQRPVAWAIDSHTGSFHSPKWRWSLPLHGWLSRKATVTIVTDAPARRLLHDWKAASLFIEDKIPELAPASGEIGTAGEKRVAVISTFDTDEPVEQIFEAARRLPAVNIYHTGDPRRASAALLANKPDNLILTGFLRGGDYSGLLQNVQGLVVLTNEPNALNCGCFEALAVGKPILVSDWPGLRAFFKDSYLYTANTSEAIAAGVEQLLLNQADLSARMVTRRTELVTLWQQKFITLDALLHVKDFNPSHN
jgi:glycosyltransferase involved in cell wall biosynthesis